MREGRKNPLCAQCTLCALIFVQAIDLEELCYNSRAHHAVLCKRRFAASSRAGPISRGFVRPVNRRNPIVAALNTANEHTFRKGTTVHRPSGAENRLNKQCKEMLATCFESVGGLPGLVKWVKESPQNRGAFYTRMWVRLGRRRSRSRSPASPCTAC